MELQAVAHTFYPNGAKRSYLFGMPKPEVKCMSNVMKLAAQNKIMKDLILTGESVKNDQKIHYLELIKTA